MKHPLTKRMLRGVGALAAGFLGAAGALDRTFQPLVMGLICASPPGWTAVLIALGAMVGYPVFWGGWGLQGSLWSLLALGIALTLGDRGITRRQRLLLPSLAALVTAGTGVLFQQLFGDDTSIPVYLLRVASGVGATALFCQWRQSRIDWSEWGVQAIAVLALAQIWPTRYLGLGFVAAGYLAAGSGLPAAALTGLALDLARVSPVKMTAVLCAAVVLRKIPGLNRWFPLLSGAMAFVPVAMLSGVWDVRPLPGLILGGALAGLIPMNPERSKPRKRTGEAAIAQVRLEQMAQALHQMEQALLLIRDPEPDRRAVIVRSCALACDACPERRGCKAKLLMPQLPEQILEQPGLGEEDLPSGCRKTGRLLGELRRGQEQLRRLKGARNRQEICRSAAREQYAFLAEFLEGLSDELAQRHQYRQARFAPEIGLSSRSREGVNGDKCIWFAGPGQSYYVLLCDGMGAGEDAARESGEAAALLEKMLMAGFPAEYALRSLNSLAVLREFGGCTTVDLVQIQLDTGKGTLYKWGAAPSYLMVSGQLRKIGTAGPPPDLSCRCREMTDRLSLSRGEMLILLSDGVSEDGLLNSARTTPTQQPGEMAAAILEKGGAGGDDATAVVIRLTRDRMPTQ